MNEKIKNYSKCKFYMEHPNIKFSTDELTGEIVEGQTMSGNFTILSTNKVPITGNVESFDHRVKMLSGDFETTSFVVNFEVNGTDLKAGDDIQGVFHVMTNGGEYEVPYEYHIIARTVVTRGGKIHNLKELSDLAQMNYEEAVRVFSDESSVSILAYGDNYAEYNRIYASLRKDAALHHGLEEFLVTIGVKDMVTVTPASNTREIYYDKEDVAGEIVLRKNTWGYLKLNVSCDSSCVFLAKKEVTKDDFVGREASIPFVIAIDELPASECNVTIHFENTNQQFDVSLSIEPKHKKYQKPPVDVTFSNGQLKKTYQKQLMGDYLNYRSSKLTLQEYTSRSIECANELMKFEEKNHWYRFIRLHMYIMKKDKVRVEQEFENIEQHEDKMISDDLSACYYRYLQALYYKGDIRISQALAYIRECYQSHPDDFAYLFMIINLDSELMENRAILINELRSCYEKGCNSPLLYYEVCELYNEFPNYLRELDEFELQVLSWGFKKHFLNITVRERLIGIIKSNYSYSNRLYRILDGLYRYHPEEALLNAICVILIKGRKTEARYHHYYALGVERSFKLIGLMEFYIRSLDYSSYAILPQQVILYFSLEAKRLNDKQLSYLYANVVVNRQSYGSAYDEYKDAISSFVIKQISQCRMDEHLEVLYREFLKDSSVIASVAKQLPNILFMNRLTVSNPNIISVLVNHDECSEPRQYPVVDNVAYIDRITEHCNVTLVDKERKRYIGSVPYEMEQLIQDDKYIGYCYEADQNCFSVLLRLAYYTDLSGDVDYEAVKVYKALLEFDEISPEYRRRLNGAILNYYYEQYEGDIFEEYLNTIDLELFDKENRCIAMEYMIDRQLYENAMNAVERYGYDGIELSRLKELCRYYVELEETVYDDNLVTMAFELFHQNEYDEAVLKYLIQFAKGSNKELLSIYQTAKKLSFDVKDLEERIVQQAIMADYYETGVLTAFEAYSKNNPNRFLYEAFLNIMAYRYFMCGQMVPNLMLILWADAYRNGHLLYPMPKAAMLCAFSGNLGIAKENLDVIAKVVDEFCQKDMLFPFMKEFDGLIKLPKEIYIRSYLVYQSEPSHVVNVHYYLKGPKRPDSHTERMREYFEGYYVKDFVLFDDEQLAYYVTDETDEEIKRLESKDVELNRNAGRNKKRELSDASRFDMINRLLFLREEGQQDEYEDMLRLYIKDLYLIDTNMSLL